MFMSDASQDMRNYDVYHTMSSVAMGPLCQSYAYLGKVRAVYPGVIPDVLPVGDGDYVPLCSQGIADLCGVGATVHEIYAMANVGGGVDCYVRMWLQRPSDVLAHYRIEVAEPVDWWRAQRDRFQGAIRMSQWAEAPSSRL